MTNTVAPQIPPRPARSHHQQQPTSATSMEVPKIPPRPKRSDKSASPHRDSFARSPLNEAPSAANQGSINTSLYSSSDQNGSSSNLGVPQRPPSVSLPSIGQEGNEYADISYHNSENAAGEDEQATSPAQTRNVGSDLPLYAPKPSLSTTSAKARVATVTRTDSSQAAAIGIGKSGASSSEDDKDPQKRSLQPKQSFTRTESSASTERPSSIQADSEHGIPEIGQRVPMYPDAGDVQAPSPSPYSQNFPSGIGFHNNGQQKPRHHGRTRSGREVFSVPPGSYGLHGHGTPHEVDRFEKDWYDKHPEALVKEEGGQYGPGLGAGRGEWALSSDDLNKIVRDTASRGAGFGTSPNIVGLPNEQIGYMASEEYASRMNSPRPQSSQLQKTQSNHSQTHVESPLRKASFPVDVEEKDVFDKSHDFTAKKRHQAENAVESETEDDDVIHVDAPEFRTSKITGNGYDPPLEDLGPRGGNTETEGGWIEERGYGTPILASDEVAKEPGSEYMQPAVPPAQDRRGSSYLPEATYDGFRSASRSGSLSGSRPTSRPGSIYETKHSNLSLSRFSTHEDREDMHTPLENVEEYEPLFPDEEDDEGKPLTAADRFKRRPDVKRRFPSQDIWEDTPNSAQLQATVTTPEPTEQQAKSIEQTPSSGFETPDVEAARKGEVSEDDKTKLIPKEERWAKSAFKPHIRDEMSRPGLKQRFPSRDIWEDSPDHASLTTTVGGPQADEFRVPPDEGLQAGAVVHTAGRPDQGKNMGEQTREGATAGGAVVAKPSIPPRPVKHKASQEGQKVPEMPVRPSKVSTQSSSPTDTKQPSPTEARKGPNLPDRPKPQVPARPAKRDSSESVPLSKTISTSSAGSAGSDPTAKSITSPPPTTKPKPNLPARPVGSKIASLKAGFLSDLDKRLQLGPQAPPKSQEATGASDDKAMEEKAPLVDARKDRARGPTRRKPAPVPAVIPEENAKSVAGAGTSQNLGLAEPWTVWHVSPQEGSEDLDVVHARGSGASNEMNAASKDKPDENTDSPLTTNATAGVSHSTDGNSTNAKTEGHDGKEHALPSKDKEVSDTSEETSSSIAAAMNKGRTPSMEPNPSITEALLARRASKDSTTSPTSPMHSKIQSEPQTLPASAEKEPEDTLGPASNNLNPAKENGNQQASLTKLTDEDKTKDGIEGKVEDERKEALGKDHPSSQDEPKLTNDVFENMVIKGGDDEDAVKD